MTKMVNRQENDSLTLLEIFKKYFTVELASTLEQKTKVFNIRYNVYCKEFAYESIESCPDEMESDEYDDFSLHCLIIHNDSLIPASCVRLVPTCKNSPDVQLPYEKHCGESLDRDFIEQLNLKEGSKCEISRLAVDGLFRKRTGEESTRYGKINRDFSKEEKGAFSLIAVAAFLAATVLTELSGKTNVFAMMEPFLPRLLKRSGIVFSRAGKDIDYHGTRAPYFITTQSALDNMRPELLELYHWIYGQVEENYYSTT